MFKASMFGAFVVAALAFAMPSAASAAQQSAAHHHQTGRPHGHHRHAGHHHRRHSLSMADRLNGAELHYLHGGKVDHAQAWVRWLDAHR